MAKDRRVKRKAAADELGVTRQRIYQLVRSGELPETEEGILWSDIQSLKERMEQGRRVGPEKVNVGDGGRDSNVTLMQARTAQAAFKAKNEEMNFKRAAGLLVSRDEVKAKNFEVARKLRDRLLAFPHRLAPQLPPELRQMVFDEFDKLVHDLQEDVAAIP